MLETNQRNRSINLILYRITSIHSKTASRIKKFTGVEMTKISHDISYCEKQFLL
jgi:hypothetical protein